MKRFLGILFCLIVFSPINGQEKKPKNDLPDNGEVIFSDFVYDFQHGLISSNDSALGKIDEIINYYAQLENECLLSNALALKARWYSNTGQGDKATQFFIKSSTYLNPSCPPFNIYYLYNSWGMMKEDLGQYDECDSIFGLALDGATKTKKTVYILNVQNNLANSKSKWAFSFKKKAPDKYRKLYDEAIEIMKGIRKKAWDEGISYHKNRSLQNLGAYYIDLEEYDSAFVYFDILLKNIDVKDEKDVAIDIYHNLGIIYQKRGNIDVAYAYTLKSLDFAKEIEDLFKIQKALAAIASMEYNRGNYATAYTYLDEYIAYKDTILNQEKVKKIEELEHKYKNDKKLLEKDLELAKRAKTRNALIGIAGALIILLIAVFSRLSYMSRSKKIVESAKKRSDELLLNILPEEVAEELKSTGKSDAKSFKSVTVLFTDFKDFTSLAEKLSPSVLVEEVNRYFQAFDDIVEKYKIEKIKTIGDSYMAAGGVPVASPEGAKRTVLAAIEMTDFVGKQTNMKGEPSIEMRVGINTGPVVAGIVGVKKFQYDIWGDTVNTASRMESACELGKVNISESTYEVLRDDPDFIFEDRGSITVKGKGKLRMYFVSRA